MFYFKQGRTEELQSLRSFAQAAFGEYNFAQMLPKLYADTAQSAQMHYALYSAEECVGLYALQIKDFNVADTKLRVGWLGTVCVKSEARGKGYLERLMSHANELLLQNNCDLAVLGGQRQRYKRFGYEYSGAHWIYTFTKRNLRNAGDCSIGLTLLNTPELQAAAFKLYCTAPIEGARCESEFNNILQSWHSVPYAVTQNGEFAGYLTLSTAENNAVVYELCVSRNICATAVCAEVLSLCKEDELTIIACLWHGDKLHEELSAECESARLAENHSFKVLNWQGVLNSGLALQNKLGFSPACGTSYIQIDAESFAFQCTEFGTSVKKCTPQENAVKFTSCDAVRLLLSHSGIYSQRLQKLPAGLFPLPLGFSWLDGI